MRKTVIVLLISAFVFVGCTTSDNGNNNTNSSASSSSFSTSSATSSLDRGEADQTIEEDGVTLRLYNTGTNSWDYVINTDLPTPCYDLNIQTIVAESFPEQVTFEVSVESPEVGIDCIQVIDPVEEAGSLSVNENATFSLEVVE